MRTRDILSRPWIPLLAEAPKQAGPRDSPARLPAPSLPRIFSGPRLPIRAGRRCGRKCGYRRQKELRARRKYTEHHSENLLLESVVIVGMELQFTLEFLAGLRICLFATEFQDGVAKQTVRVRIFWIQLNGFSKFSDGGFGKMADRIGAAHENMQGGGISHGVLQVLKPLLGIGKSLGFEVGYAEKVRSFKILIESDGSVEIANGRVKVSPVKINSTEYILRAGVTWVTGDYRLRESPGLLDIARAEPGDRRIDSNIGIAGGELEGFVQFASGFFEARFGYGKISELTEAESNGSIVMAFRLECVAGREGRLGGFIIMFV